MDSQWGGRVVAGSRVGAEHLRVARNNQDAYAVAVEGGRLVGVVADGCSSGAASEVGAVLGASWVAGRLARMGGSFGARSDAEAAAEALARDLDRALLGWSGGDPAMLARCFLFTFLAAVVEGETLSVLGVGDGVLLTPAGLRVLDAGPDNAPDYAAYRLLADEHFEGPRPRSIGPLVHHVGPFRAGDAALVASDGAAVLRDELAGWLADPALWRGPRALDRRLNLRAAALFDDTTIVAVKSCA